MVHVCVNVPVSIRVVMCVLRPNPSAIAMAPASDMPLSPRSSTCNCEPSAPIRLPIITAPSSLSLHWVIFKSRKTEDLADDARELTPFWRERDREREGGEVVYIHERIFCHKTYKTYKNTYIVFDWVMVQD